MKPGAVQVVLPEKSSSVRAGTPKEAMSLHRRAFIKFARNIF
jgi:hypothetical protein